MKIYTDHKWKKFKYRNEVPKSVLKNQFDYLNEDDNFDGYILYKKTWYHLSDFMKIIELEFPIKLNFDAYISDSFYSGVMIKLSDDGKEYQIATFIS